MNDRNWWLLSAAVSAVGIVTLLVLWSRMNRYDFAEPQLVDRAAVDGYLERHWESRRNELNIVEPMVKIETGLFIQSLKFFDSSEVNLSGYVWQRYVDGVNDHLKPDPSQVGFIFPEQVDTASSTLREAFRHRNGREEVVGWYFEATLRQRFEYSTYPFDHKTVWLRMWPRQFSSNIVLVPDFAAYEKTGPTDIFGIENAIVLGTWRKQNTFFDYKLSSYDTNFGIDNYVGQAGFPELFYNVVIKRRFGNAFVVHLLPLFLVAALLYGALLTISDDETLAGRHGFSTSGVIGTCSALFFVVLLAHIQLREQFAGATIVYMEYFYFLMYAMLVAAATYTFLFSTGAGRWLKFMHYRDNLLLKIGFWPVVLYAMAAITGVAMMMTESPRG